ncbi:MAG: iron chaperone [Flavobacteriales bacterium]
MKSTKIPSTVDGFISGFPADVQKHLQQMRQIIKAAAPDAEEGISYGMPGYKLKGKPLVYFSAYKNHIGFYATPTGHKAFEKELSKYKQGKGSVQFQLDEPIPFKLIEKIVKFRVKENTEKAKKK